MKNIRFLSGICISVILLSTAACSWGPVDSDDSVSPYYTVTFNSHDATTEADPPSKKVSSPATTIDALPTAPEKSGFTFGGWFFEENGTGDEFTAGTEVSSDITVYAKWNWQDYQLRDPGPSGGLIFYINPDAESDGWKYLEAWTTDEIGTYQWKTSETLTPGAQYFDIGRGKTNTIAMTGTDHPAAEVVRESAHGGYEDWFLPSKNELNQMYVNLHQEERGGFADASYWSSSTHMWDTAWDHNFQTGAAFTPSPKTFSRRVRAIRSF